jgi:myosin-5
VVNVPAGERNFHFFYQLCAGASAAERIALQLGDRTACDFRYLSAQQQSGQAALCIGGVDDAAAYGRTMEAMAALGFTPTEREHVTRLVAAILHLGDVQFVAAGDGSDLAPAATTAATAVSSPS